MAEKTAVLRPIPNARVRTAMVVNPGFFSRIRIAYLRLFIWAGVSFDDVDATGHLADIDARDALQRSQIDHLDRPGLRSDTFDGDERVAVVAGDCDAVNHATLRCDARELLSRCNVDDRDGFAALVRAHEQLAIACDGEVVDPVAGRNA